MPNTASAVFPDVVYIALYHLKTRASSLPHHVSLGSLFNLFMPQHPHLYSWGQGNNYCMGLLSN